MSETGGSWPLSVGDEVVAELRRRLDHVAHRVEPVGSVRRRRPRIHDVDVMVELRAPYPWSVERTQRILKLVGKWVKGASKLHVIDNTLGHRGLRTDVFLVYPPRNWYALLALRTGPASDSVALKEGLKAMHRREPFSELVVASEDAMYELAGLEYRPPEERDDEET